MFVISRGKMRKPGNIFFFDIKLNNFKLKINKDI